MGSWPELDVRLDGENAGKHSFPASFQTKEEISLPPHRDQHLFWRPWNSSSTPAGGQVPGLGAARHWQGC